jgi:hypothetical protein
MSGRTETGIVLRRWQRDRQNSRIGYADITLPNGLEIDGIIIQRSHGSAWISMPAFPRLNAAGRQVVIDGKKRWDTILRWPDPDIKASVQDDVLALVRAADPEAFADGGDPE